MNVGCEMRNLGYSECVQLFARICENVVLMPVLPYSIFHVPHRVRPVKIPYEQRHPEYQLEETQTYVHVIIPGGPKATFVGLHHDPGARETKTHQDESSLGSLWSIA